ncbi:MAG: RrF2 family transcriptional regulator [Patescibacteria group bacterium]
MMFSTRSEYALRAVIELARQWRDNCAVSVHTIAQDTGIPYQYLEQLIHPLRRAHIVTAQRGVKGGYRLAHDPSKLTVQDILQCMEYDIAPFKCPGAGNFTCIREDHCAAKRVWHELARSISHTAQEITIADLI